MTNSIAIVLGILVVGAIAADVIAFEASNLLFLGKKLASLIEWLAFWR
jgi:mannose/fructose/N-acetylgalactosamine-specific phosphotransferase system component IID